MGTSEEDELEGWVPGRTARAGIAEVKAGEGKLGNGKGWEKTDRGWGGGG